MSQHDDYDDPRNFRRRRGSQTAKITPPKNTPDPQDSAPSFQSLVCGITARACKIHYEGALFDCALPSKLMGGVLAVGDQILWKHREDRREAVEILPRRSVLSRPDSFDAMKEQVLAANVDHVVVVVSVVAPPLHPRLIDRCLVAVSRGGAEPILVVNKWDLLQSEDEQTREEEQLRPYKELRVPILRTSTATGAGIEELRALLKGKTITFLGHSGVGKSSLANRLYPEAAAETGGVSTGNRKGKHTTTAAVLYQCNDGTRVIDTPGVRSFGLWNINGKNLREYFPEFDVFAANCRFTDCSHSHEPSCGVREAAKNGEVDPARFATYQRLLESVDEG